MNQPDDARKNLGKVWLVGAGPGDPDLLTIKADRILSTADEIFYDDLVNKTIVNKYPGNKIYVGKRKGMQSFSQDQINKLLYKSAMRGNTVVRLKGGDPLIFSRGGEELAYLQSRCISVEVVPGLTAVQVCAASTGIPLTKRNVARSFGIASCHYAENSEIPVLSTDTRVYYMASSKLRELADRLIATGSMKDTPVALIKSGGLPDEVSYVTTLGDLGSMTIASPVTVIIGDVVKEYRRTENFLKSGAGSAQSQFFTSSF